MKSSHASAKVSAPERPRISTKVSWAEIDGRILQIVRDALSMLKQKAHSPEKVHHEDELSRQLYKHLVKVDRELMKVDKRLTMLGVPVYQAKCQPHSSDPEQAPREKTIPDFQWSIRNLGISIGGSRKGWDTKILHYHVECKRLGKSTTSWTLNENYVERGIQRFIERNHGYGKGVNAGTMIGYIQSMEPHEIFAEVNVRAALVPVPLINLSFEGWQIAGVSQLEHMLDRPGVLPTPFHLHHLWVDLRSHPPLVKADDLDISAKDGDER